MAEEHSGSSRTPGRPQQGQSPPCETSSAPPCSHSATWSRRRCRSSSSPSACSSSPTALLDPTPPRRVVLATGQDQGAYAEFGKRYAQILKENGIEVRPAEDRRRGREHRAAAPAGGERRHRLRAGRRRRRPAAGERRQRRRRRRPGVARQPVLRAGLAVLSRRLGPAPAQGARADEPRAARRLARQHRRARQRRAQPDAPADRGEPHRPGDDHARARAADAGGGRPAGRPHRRDRLRLGARVAAGADAAADAGHPPLRLRPGRGLLAALSAG